MDDPVTWLRAQLDKDERMAPGVHLEICSSMSRTIRNGVVWAVGDCDCGVPTRVLREVEAKRRILDDHAGVPFPYGPEYCEADGWCRNPTDSDLRQRMPCLYVRLLALPYADREGYREEWRPE